MGFLLWEEIPVYWAIAFDDPATYEDARNQLCELVKRDRNHPAVVIWSFCNEAGCEGEHEAAARDSGVFTLVQLLKASGVQNYTLYDGGYATHAGISHAVSCYEDLMTTADGRVRTYAEYLEEARILAKMTPEERISYRMKGCIEKRVDIQPINKLVIRAVHLRKIERCGREIAMCSGVDGVDALSISF